MTSKEMLVELLSIALYEHDCLSDTQEEPAIGSWVDLTAKQREAYRCAIRDARNPERLRVYEASLL